MPKRYWWVIITYIIMQISGVIFAPILFVVFPISEFDAVIYWSIISFASALVVVILLMRPDMKMESHRNASSAGNVILWSFLGVFMAFAAQGIAGMIEVELLGIDPGSENTQEIMDIARAAPIFMIIPAIIAPILEEIIFRKIIFGQFYARTNFFIAALLSALIFGIIHLDPTHMLIYASMGFVFAFLYVKTKRIIVPIIVHMAMNTIVVLVQFGLDPEDIERMQREMEQMQMILLGG
ncbi:membrane protease YdiL (CAAX protease family) [Virgibacillus natechei]|uniref:Membrane protease YdiL (CAAX protease family) n=1 Tax=Virgibacillus natechei TaxID=1216297 RepID=A0ABS4ILA7_9BACI|nr:type II CAAX endopeptidase family protein [Virgibacillus natechei]MBP1971663.1 membrane protease YdiL (CAAX protease family) [Virgibacillus natechei]UZD13850.1 CPBP family intramembrane metalloprotease [Virgibacillus natechei]